MKRLPVPWHEVEYSVRRTGGRIAFVAYRDLISRCLPLDSVLKICKGLVEEPFKLISATNFTDESTAKREMGSPQDGKSLIQ
jgi:hypothetical protein